MMDFDDRLGISICIRAYTACWNQHDVHGMSLCFDDNAIVIDSFGIRHQGRAAIRRGYLAKHERRLQAFNLSMDSVTIEACASDLAHAHCMWTVRHQQDTNRDDSGVYRLLLQRQTNGSWLIHEAQVIR